MIRRRQGRRAYQAVYPPCFPILARNDRADANADADAGVCSCMNSAIKSSAGGWPGNQHLSCVESPDGHSHRRGQDGEAQGLQR